MFKSMMGLDDKHGTATREMMKKSMEHQAKPKVSIVKKARRVVYHIGDAERSELSVLFWMLGVFAVGVAIWFVYGTWPR